MNLQGFELISSNIDVLRYIFELLTFEQQLMLANVNRQLQWVFKNFVWKEKYKSVEIIKGCVNYGHYGRYIIRNETDTNSLVLDNNQLNEFVNIYRYDFEELRANRWPPALKLKHFPNLTSIAYNDMKITKDDMQLLANNCHKLVKLHIFYCKNEKDEYFNIGEDLPLYILCEMKSLTHLSIQNFKSYKLKPGDLLDIITGLKLKYLNLNVGEINNADYDPIDIAKMALVNTLQLHLQITYSYTSLCPWSTRLNMFLRNFENLQSLTLSSVKSASQDVLESLAHTCKNLKLLIFRQTTFKDIQQFSVLNALTELNLYYCHGLTHEDLKEILNEMRLMKFTSIATEYTGVYEHFEMTPTIKSLNIDTIRTTQFREFPQSLKELTWYGADDEISLMCPHIEVLEIYGNLSIDHLLELKSLHELTITQTMSPVTFSFLMALLRHPSLRKFYVWRNFSFVIFDDNDLTIHRFDDIPENLSLETIAIPILVFEYAPRFWLNFLVKIPQLQMWFRSDNGRQFDINFYYNLSNHLELPPRLKSFHFAGFKVDCSEFRRNKFKTMDKLFETINCLPESEYRLIFQY